MTYPIVRVVPRVGHPDRTEEAEYIRNSANLPSIVNWGQMDDTPSDGLTTFDFGFLTVEAAEEFLDYVQTTWQPISIEII